MFAAPTPDVEVSEADGVVRLRFPWRRDGLLHVCVVGPGMGFPFGLAVFGLVYAVIDPTIEDDIRPFVVGFLGTLATLSGLPFGMGTMLLVRLLFTPRVLVDVEVDRFDLRTLPWRTYRLTVAAVRGVEVLVFAAADDGAASWLSVRVEGRGRLVYVRLYTSCDRAAEAGVARAAEALAAVLGVPITRREMSAWERLTRW